MKITDLLKPCSIELNGRAASKEEVICKMVDLMAASGNARRIGWTKIGDFRNFSKNTAIFRKRP